MKKKKPVIEILIVGDEILSNPAQERNVQYIVDTLLASGFKVDFISIVGDVIYDIVKALENSSERADIVLVTGGLGPTSDDVTVEAFAKTFGLNLVLDKKVLKWIEDVFRRRNRYMSDSNRKQAMIPESSTPLENRNGTAPGIFIEMNDTDFYLMPGVPVEMEIMFYDIILPRIRDSYKSSQADVATLSVTGISESELYSKIGCLPRAKDAVKYYPCPEGIIVKITAGEDSHDSLVILREKILDILGDLVYSTKGESLEQVVGEMLIEKGITIASAESCTGGLVAHRLTKIPGASNYLLCDVVAYSNESKHKILGVEKELIRTHGAVSAEVVSAMSEGVRKISGADIGISTSGIAGPGGGSEEKPIGLLYIGISADNGTETKKLQFVEDRLINISMMSQVVLDMLRYYLKGKL
ncbi:competence/damage-inducible protein A [Candidatus Latescibacterota bacterium]